MNEFFKRLNLKQGLLVITTLLFTLVSQAQLKVKSLQIDSGRPLEITYTNNYVAQVVRKEKIDAFRAPVILNENTCKPAVGLKCQFVLPYIRQSYAAVWKSHPTRQGQPLQYGYNPNVTYGKQTFMTRTQPNEFEQILNRFISTGIDVNAAREVQNDKNLFRLECESDVNAAFPTTKEILFIDENYEGGNTELEMSNREDLRVNLFWRRYQNMSLAPAGNVMRIQRYKKAYGMFTDSMPTGLAYSIQMTFRAPNIKDPTDEVCTMRWDMNFSIYFAQITQLAIGGNQKFNPAGYSIFHNTFENSNPYAKDIFEKAQWEHAGLE